MFIRFPFIKHMILFPCITYLCMIFSNLNTYCTFVATCRQAARHRATGNLSLSDKWKTKFVCSVDEGFANSAEEWCKRRKSFSLVAYKLNVPQGKRRAIRVNLLGWWSSGRCVLLPTAHIKRFDNHITIWRSFSLPPIQGWTEKHIYAIEDPFRRKTK